MLNHRRYSLSIHFFAGDSDEVRDLKDSLKVVDAHLQAKLVELRRQVPKTANAILDERQDRNKQNTFVPIFIMLGVWLQQVASNLALTGPPMLSTILSRIGSSTAAASFAGSRAQRVNVSF